jgi:hypothetical protein
MSFCDIAPLFSDFGKSCRDFRVVSFTKQMKANGSLASPMPPLAGAVFFESN